MNEDEKRLIELANELSKKTTGYELSELEEYSLLKFYRSNNQHLLSKIIMTRNGPKIIAFKEEDDNDDDA